MTNEEAINQLIIWYGMMTANDKPIKHYMETIELAIKALETQTWIPVTERLPENYTKVLVTYRGCVIEAKLELVGYDNRRMWNSDSLTYLEDATNGKVTAWMPLPEPYKESEGAE